MNITAVLIKLEPRLFINRLFSTSDKNLKNYAARQNKIMNKLMFGTSGKKRRYNIDESSKTPMLPTAQNLSKGALEGGKSKNSKRIAVLNKLFMKNITDLMATGEYSQEFLGRGIEISRVQITPDFKGVNVFWLAKGSLEDENLESLLNKNAGALRHELSQLRVMGVVPIIHFVKDKHYAKLAEVDIQLCKADFGDDYIPIDPSYRLKTEFSLNSKLPEDMKLQIEALGPGDENEEPLPPMRHDVFGLNHAHLMNKIKATLKKSKAIHRLQEPIIERTTVEAPSPIMFESMRAQRQAFEEFLHKRQVLKAKAKRDRDKNYLPDKEYLQELEALKEEYEEVRNLHDDDFIDEFDDKIR